MNSQEEQDLFISYGWTYDYIARRWVSPDQQYQVTTDELVTYNDSPANEQRLVEAIVQHGRPSKP